MVTLTRDRATDCIEQIEAAPIHRIERQRAQTAGSGVATPRFRPESNLALPLAEYQREHIWNEARYVVIEATTKSGKTHGCIVWQYEQALATKGHHWWLAPVYGQARIAYERIRDAVPVDARKTNDSDLTITLPNGAVWDFKSAEHPDRLYGEDVHSAVIDEASRCREEAFHAVRSTLTATRAPIRLIGNVKGRKNWAYRMARRAESGEPDMHYGQITALDAVKAGIIAHDEVEDARRTLPEAVFRELYMAEPSDDTGNPFGIKAIRACIDVLSDAEPAHWGWDLAKSVDWTVGIALDKLGNVCQVHRFQGDWFSTGLRIRSTTGSVPALVDATGVGDPVVEDLQRYGGNFEPFKFSSSSKQQLMEALAVAIQQHEITFPDGPIVQELEAFEYEFTRTGVRYSAPEGMHDDCVCGLALAVMCRQRVAAPNIRFLSW